MKAIITILLFTAFCGQAFSQQNTECTTPEQAAQAQAQMETSLKSIREAQRKREAELDNDVQATANRLGWTNQAQAKFFNDMLASPEFAAFETEKRPLTTEIMGIVTAANQQNIPSTPAASCQVANQLNAIVEKVKEINARQYDFMYSKITTAQ
ncbi:hypothetical protein [Methylophilus luteus]|uniref:Uncharacterized protein n=1 Tax=Methylophilus luteus TaxID=640108 RepID=A0ABW3F5Q9_9PROT